MARVQYSIIRAVGAAEPSGQVLRRWTCSLALCQHLVGLPNVQVGSAWPARLGDRWL